MTDSELIAKFEDDFGKLVRNREQVPMDKLRTTYKKSYDALVTVITEFADWFADRYLQTMIDSWPRHERDVAGNEWMERRINVILDQENQPGGLREQWRAALIDRLDKEEYQRLVWQRYELLEKKVFDPYWQRHNRWRGEPGNRWIFNDIIQRFWLPPGENEKYPDGAWINSKFEVYATSWPPNIGPDPVKEGIVE